jgi:hypothetical protein
MKEVNRNSEEKRNIKITLKITEQNRNSKMKPLIKKKKEKE